MTMEKWPCDATKKPNPITIRTAREILAAGCSQIPCEMEEAGDHGHAWMIETPEDWTAWEGTHTVVSMPTKPKRPSTCTVEAKWKHAEEKRGCEVHFHLMQEGKARSIEWFGKAPFVNLCQNGLSPVTKTPRDLSDHLSDTQAQPRDVH